MLVASQWGERSSAQFFDVPERRLLVAVLVDAVRVLLGSDPRERAGVITWVKGGSARIPFQDLCLNLDIDPERIARKLLRPRVLRREARRRRIAPRRRVSCGAKRARLREAAYGERGQLSA